MALLVYTVRTVYTHGMSKWIGLREARKEIGPIADRAHLAGEITFLSRNGKPIAAVVPIDRIKEPAMPRNVISTNAYIEVTEEYAEQVDAILDKAIPLRETYDRDDIGQKSFRVWVAEYDAPDGGGTRWAVDYYDTASREVEEFDNQADAELRYEEMVRATAENLGTNNDDEQETFTETDVPDVPGYED